jgi:hypothetical protein
MVVRQDRRRALLTAALCALVAAGCTQAEDWRLDSHSLGPVRTGMSAEQASGAVGPPGLSGEHGAEECWYLRHHADGRDFDLMIIKGVVVRIELNRDSRLQTVEGAHIGSSEADLKRLYGARLDIQPHKYEPDGHTLTLRSPDGAHGLRFETWADRVTAIQAGPWEHLHYVEGCS